MWSRDNEDTKTITTAAAVGVAETLRLARSRASRSRPRLTANFRVHTPQSQYHAPLPIRAGQVSEKYSILFDVELTS